MVAPGQAGDGPPIPPDTAPGEAPGDPHAHPAVRAAVAAPGPWRRVEHHREVGSTNEVASRRASAGAAPGLVVVADHQTVGRGRRGRRWQDRGRCDPASSLLVSFLLAPPRPPELVPLAAGLAVRDALRAAGAEPVLKWPNDVLVPVGPAREHRKCAGVLVEHRPGLGDDPGTLVVGVGVDVDWRGHDRVGEPARWASVAESVGGPVDRWEVLAELMDALGRRLDEAAADAEGLRRAYSGACVTLGRPVVVDTGVRRISGRAGGLTARGALVVETTEGPVTVTVGDVREVDGGA